MSFYFKSFQCITTEGTPLLLHIYCFIKHSLFLYTSSFVCLRDQLKQMKVEMQRKLVCNKYEASTSLMALALRYVFILYISFCLLLQHVHAVHRIRLTQNTWRM
jgi:hypothetical protein